MAAESNSNNVEFSDLELVTRAGAGETAAFNGLVERHAEMLLRFALRKTAKREDAEDLVQETFEGAIRSAASFKGDASVRGWLMSILFRRAARHHRYWKLRKTDELNETHDSQTGNGVPKEASPVASLDTATVLASLPEAQREVMVLREVEGFTYQEIADTLDIPRGTVESRLFRARQHIRETFSDYFVQHAGAEPVVES